MSQGHVPYFISHYHPTPRFWYNPGYSRTFLLLFIPDGHYSDISIVHSHIRSQRFITREGNGTDMPGWNILWSQALPFSMLFYSNCFVSFQYISCTWANFNRFLFIHSLMEHLLCDGTAGNDTQPGRWSLPLCCLLPYKQIALSKIMYGILLSWNGLKAKPTYRLSYLQSNWDSTDQAAPCTWYAWTQQLLWAKVSVGALSFLFHQRS